MQSVFECQLCGARIPMPSQVVRTVMPSQVVRQMIGPSGGFTVTVQVNHRRVRQHLAGHKAQILMRLSQHGASVVTDRDDLT